MDYNPPLKILKIGKLYEFRHYYILTFRTLQAALSVGCSSATPDEQLITTRASIWSRSVGTGDSRALAPNQTFMILDIQRDSHAIDRKYGIQYLHILTADSLEWIAVEPWLGFFLCDGPFG